LHRTGRSLPPHHAPGCGTPPAAPSPYRAPTECRVPGSGCSRPAGRLPPGGGGRSGMAGHAQAHGCVSPMATVRPVRSSPDCAHRLAIPIAEERTHVHAQPFDRVPDRAGRPVPAGRRKSWPGRGTEVRPRRLAPSDASATWRRPGSAGARGSAGDPRYRHHAAGGEDVRGRHGVGAVRRPGTPVVRSLLCENSGPGKAGPPPPLGSDASPHRRRPSPQLPPGLNRRPARP